MAVTRDEPRVSNMLWAEAEAELEVSRTHTVAKCDPSARKSLSDCFRICMPTVTWFAQQQHRYTHTHPHTHTVSGSRWCWSNSPQHKHDNSTKRSRQQVDIVFGLRLPELRLPGECGASPRNATIYAPHLRPYNKRCQQALHESVSRCQTSCPPAACRLPDPPWVTHVSSKCSGGVCTTGCPTPLPLPRRPLLLLIWHIVSTGERALCAN